MISSKPVTIKASLFNEKRNVRKKTFINKLNKHNASIKELHAKSVHLCNVNEPLDKNQLLCKTTILELMQHIEEKNNLIDEYVKYESLDNELFEDFII